MHGRAIHTYIHVSGVYAMFAPRRWLERLASAAAVSRARALPWGHDCGDNTAVALAAVGLAARLWLCRGVSLTAAVFGARARPWGDDRGHAVAVAAAILAAVGIAARLRLRHGFPLTASLLATTRGARWSTAAGEGGRTGALSFRGFLGCR